jgi:hypothetical protein
MRKSQTKTVSVLHTKNLFGEKPGNGKEALDMLKEADVEYLRNLNMSAFKERQVCEVLMIMAFDEK